MDAAIAYILHRLDERARRPGPSAKKMCPKIESAALIQWQLPSNQASMVAKGDATCRAATQSRFHSPKNSARVN